MSNARGRNFLYDVLMPKVYGLGAAVVILGALFKLMHWQYGDEMLIAGLGTEAIIFALSAFQPVHAEPDWARVYPQLAEDYSGDGLVTTGGATGGVSLSKKLDDMMSDADITPDTIQRLGLGLNRLSDTTAQMADLSQATAATQDYTLRVKSATESLDKINVAYAETAQAITALAGSTSEAKEYHTQIQSMTKNLGALNAVYEMELQDANNHMRAMSKFYGNLSAAMENLSDASKDTAQLKEEVSKLTKNMYSLNTVYGNMLTAMKS